MTYRATSVSSSQRATRGFAMRTVMVVEDDRDIRHALGDVLSSAGYRAVTADDGETALKLLASGTTPDVIVTDLRMPRMNGFELVRALRSSAKSQIPVVVLTATRRYDPAGLPVSAILHKPVDAAELIAAIERSAAPNRTGA